ncbi:MAG: DNA repair protein RadA [Eubacteriales bacterium]|nr:DNA repair protein RadA [Eubacteriales bacterium]MDY3332828.1 DNA repair protein RadA [Gallibacter sp.]
MAKKCKTVFVCQECGYESSKWQGRCSCGAWNSFVEEKPIDFIDDVRSRNTDNITRVKSVKLKEIKTDDRQDRIDTKIGEFNRVLGGGVVRGSLTLISGEPGIGKSTIIMQSSNNIAKQGLKVLYVSGEESANQLKMRASRICSEISDNLMVMAETNIENIFDVIKEIKADFLIVDSIQTLYSSGLDSAPGSVSQVRHCGNELMRIGKAYNIPIFIVAHVTKSGELAGPKIVEHLVDCVLYFSGERNHELRILRAYKNRFGTTSEIGAFEMDESGLVEIENLSQAFISDRDCDTEGAILTGVYEGSRPMLLEVQALTASNKAGFARRTAIGVDVSRLNMLLAVLERKMDITLSYEDVYVNIVGGIKPEGTYIDLALIFAIYSSYRNKKIDSKTIAIGEVGLTGEVRNVPNTDKIIKEASRMGVKNIVLPNISVKKLKDNIKGVNLIGVSDLRQAIDILFN